MERNDRQLQDCVNDNDHISIIFDLKTIKEVEYALKMYREVLNQMDECINKPTEFSERKLTDQIICLLQKIHLLDIENLKLDNVIHLLTTPALDYNCKLIAFNNVIKILKNDVLILEKILNCYNDKTNLSEKETINMVSPTKTNVVSPTKTHVVSPTKSKNSKRLDSNGGTKKQKTKNKKTKPRKNKSHSRRKK